MAEPLESRVLFSADGLLGLFADLLPDVGDNGSRWSSVEASKLLESVVKADPQPSNDTARIDTKAATDHKPDIAAPETIDPMDVLTAAPDTERLSANTLVFVDLGIPDAQTIINSLRATGADIVLIHSNQDGLLVVSQHLADRSDVAAVHIISHGSPGSLSLGSTELTADSLQRNSNAIAQWGNALSSDADILLYGCNLAATEDGRFLIDSLAELTQADVAASVDLTGHASVGGDWQLEYTSGEVTASAIANSLSGAWAYALADVNVSTTLDTVDAPDLNSIAALLANKGADGEISLREAVIAAENSAGVDSVFLLAEIYTLTLSGAEENNNGGDLDINADVNIVGSTTGTTTIQMGWTDRVIDVNAGNSTISNVTITGGDKNSDGGGIVVQTGAELTLNDVIIQGNVARDLGGGVFNLGTLTMNRVLVDNNQSTSDHGGGIYNDGVMTLTDVIVSANSANKNGGGIENSGQAILQRVTINNNTALDAGGGIHHGGGGATMDLLNVTVSGNTGNNGGGINAQKDISITSSTIVGNVATNKEGGLWMSGAATGTLLNTIIANNTTANGSDFPNTAGSINSLGFNLFSDTPPIALSSTDIVNTDPLLDALAPSAGYVTTHAPSVAGVTGSPVINSGGNVTHTSDAANGALNEIPDIGAHEHTLASGVIFWTDSSGNILRSDPDFQYVQTLITGRNQPTDIEVDVQNGRIYWLEKGDESVYSAALDGTGITQMLTGLTDATGIALNVAASQIYVAAGGTTLNISRYNLIGPAVPVIITTAVTDPQDLEIDVANDRIYWTDRGGVGNDSTIQFVSLDGSSTGILVNNSNLDLPAGLAIDLDTEDVFWVDPGTDDVGGSTFSGFLTVTAAASIGGPMYVTYDSVRDYILYTSPGNQMIGVVDTADLTLTTNPFSVVATVAPVGIAYGLTSSAGAAPVAVDDSLTVVEGGSGNVLDSTETSVLSNDTDADLPADSLSVVAFTQGLDGVVTVNADGTFIYTHDGTESFNDFFTYTVEDSYGEQDVGTVNVVITPDNDNDPVGGADALTVAEGGTASVLDSTATSVLDNDTDADLPNDTLQVIANTQGTYGSVTVNADGSFSYSHNGSENFSDSFTYTVRDAGGAQDIVTVNVVITPDNDNDPVGVADSVTVAEGGTASVLDSTATSVLDNDTDADLPNDTLQVIANTQGTYGSVTVNADGSFSYSHNGSENFSDSFTYTVRDAGGAQDIVTVNVVITPDNDNDPVGVADSVTVAEGGTASVLDSTATSVLDNDTDADLPNDTLQVIANTQGTYGSVTVNADGSFSYSHNGSENFSDSFTYTVQDAGGAQDIVTVSVVITPDNDNDPVGGADALTVSEGGASTVLNSAATSVLDNDTDADLPNDTLQVVANTQGAHGSVTVNADGSFSYMHNGTENFSDSFTYTVQDAGGAQDIVTVSVVITPDNDNDPVGGADALTVSEGGASTGSAATSVLDNDTDADSPNVLKYSNTQPPVFWS